MLSTVVAESCQHYYAWCMYCPAAGCRWGMDQAVSSNQEKSGFVSGGQWRVCCAVTNERDWLPECQVDWHWPSQVHCAVCQPVERCGHWRHHCQDTAMADTDNVQSVRGKGWVTFDENKEEQSSSSNTTPRKSSQPDTTAAAETSPGSIEVRDSDCVRWKLNTLKWLGNVDIRLRDIYRVTSH